MDEKIINNQLRDNHVDDHVDNEIRSCLSGDSAKSFFMFAGAGSGKTRSLINALEYLDREKGRYLNEHGKQVAVITYTNAACDEIGRRLQYKSIFLVSTIHSFLWELVKNYQTDIKAWVIASIQSDIEELVDKQSKGRGGDAAVKRAQKLQNKIERLERVKKVKRFSYNPNGDNVGYDSLNHSEVIKMGSEFVENEETMQRILVDKYPILLIDESQDTKKELVDALLNVYEKHKKHWTIGMFGDTMQKIYMDGKERLSEAIPKEWVFPVKIMNHRSAKRIVALSNSIRGTIDDKQQQPRTDAIDGTVRLFIANSCGNKEKLEQQVASLMSNVTDDSDWENAAAYKCLILEHHMAASRFSFKGIFEPLNNSGAFDTSLRDGSIAELSFLANTILPLIKAHQEEQNFEVAKIIRRHSPLMSKKTFAEQPEIQMSKLEQVEKAAENLFELWNDAIPSCIEVLRSIRTTNLFEIGDRIDDILDDFYTGENVKVVALKKALTVPFDELERYAAYVSNQTRFATHQGIKGLEFPRVMVILDDAEAKGFSFSYEKLFGAKTKTDTDLRNEKEGKETSIMRTARLFYVACTRAQKSLAVISYTESPEVVKKTALDNMWFTEDEIVLLN
jgi:DNA helicase-2/ATP-dependent DNA helicase PcrA